jgi:alpha-glucosidase (family GH31 glycosyl hydrolase)
MASASRASATTRRRRSWTPIASSKSRWAISCSKGAVGDDDWGSHRFDKTRFLDPTAMIGAVHDEHANFMIPAWPKFHPTTDA